MREAESLFDLDFIDSFNGWAVGKLGLVLHTQDGGRTYEELPAATDRHLHGVKFIDPAEGWVVGEDGTIMRTADGGQSWLPQTSGVAETLRGVEFIDSSSGWAVGENGALFTTTDAGNSWSASPSSTPQHLYDLDFIDRDRAWAVGANGTVLHTSNGGQAWAEQRSGTREDLLSVGFANAKRGWAVGRRGTIIRTERGGESWSLEEIGTRHDLYKVHVVDGTTAFAVGNLGLLLSYFGRADVPLGVILSVIGLIILTAFAATYLWRRYFCQALPAKVCRSYNRYVAPWLGDRSQQRRGWVGSLPLAGNSRGMSGVLSRRRAQSQSSSQNGGPVPRLDAETVPLPHQGGTGGRRFKSSRQPLNPPAKTSASSSSYCHLVHPNSRATSREVSPPMPRVFASCMMGSRRSSPSTGLSWNGSASTTPSVHITPWTAVLLSNATQAWSPLLCLICTERRIADDSTATLRAWQRQCGVGSNRNEPPNLTFRSLVEDSFSVG